MIALVAAGLASYLVILLADFPAAIAWSFVVPQSAPVTARAIHGTIWAGRLDDVSVSRLRLRKLSWTVQGWDLLIGQLAFDIRIQSRYGKGSGTLSDLGTRHWSLRGVHAAIPLDGLSRAFTRIHLKASGTLHLALTHLAVDGPALKALDGTGSAARVTIHSVIPVTLAEVRLEAHSVPRGGSLITFDTGPGGSLLVQGRILLGPARHWKLVARFKPAPHANPTLIRILSGYGAAGPHGFYTLHLKGVLPDLSRIDPDL
ncbi:general secretion pathway protein N [mine drainage metagenome]|uniref:General secretion pathway protein N n=1 Tax=mine drainage metagenome TaxID=410659 RepID=T0ZQ70_9ZZZZ